MSLPVLITYLALDSSYDPVFTPEQSLTNLQAVSQAILTRLRLWLGEWWEDLSLGLPVFQVILGQLGTARGQAAMNLVIQEQIRGTPYVTGVDNVVFSFNEGQFSFTANVQTLFGTTIVAAGLPGNAASLGGL